MLDANIHYSLNTLTASQVAKLLVMRKGLEFGYAYTFTDYDGQDSNIDNAFLSAAPGELLDTLFDENEHDDAINEVRYDAEEKGDVQLAEKIGDFQFRDIRPKAASEILDFGDASLLLGHTKGDITERVYRRIGAIAKPSK